MADTNLKEACAVQKTAIVILNSDSAAAAKISELLVSLGVDSAASVDSVQDNSISFLNKLILESSGSSNSSWEGFNGSWLLSPKSTEFLKKGLKAVNSEFDDSHLMLFNDPGMAQLLPFWKIVFEQAGILARYVFVVEDPAKLAGELWSRLDVDPRAAHLTWLRIALDAEFHSRSTLRAFVDPIALGEQPATAMETVAKLLDLTFPRNIRSTFSSNPALMADLRAQSRRMAESERFAEEHEVPTDWVKIAHMTFAQWAKDGEKGEEYYLVDAVREAFDDAAPAFLGIGLASPAATARVQELEQELENARAAVSQARAAEMALRTRVEQEDIRARQELEALRQGQAELRHRLSHLGSELAQRKAEVDDGERALQLAREEVVALKRDVVRLRDSAQEEAKIFNQKILASTQAKDEADGQLRDRYKEIVTLSRKLATESAAAESFKRRTQRLKLIALLFEQGGARGRFSTLISAIMPWRWHLTRISRRIEREGAFDGAAYLAANPDVARSGMNPLKHYLIHGIDENRSLGID